MHFRIFIQQLKRDKKKTLLYTLLLMAVTAFFVMSANLYKNSTANLKDVEETYSTIALMELYGDVNKRGELVEPFSEEHIGYKSVAVNGYDFSEIVTADRVIDWDLRERYAAHIKDELAISHEGFLMSSYDILRFKIKGDEPKKIPIERGSLSLDSENAEFEVELLDQAQDRYIYIENFRFQPLNHSERLPYIDQEKSKAEARAFNRSDEENYLILYPDVEYIGSFRLASNWKPAEQEGMFIPAGGKRTYVQPECLPYAQGDFFVRYGTSKEYIDEGYNNADIRYTIQRWEDVQKDPELKSYFEKAAEALKIQYSVFNVELTSDFFSLPNMHLGTAYVLQGRAFTEEEYESGAKVCMISAALADKQGWEIGDKLPMDFFEFPAFPNVNYEYFENQAIWNEETEGFFDSGEYEIIGMYSQTTPIGNSGIARSTLELPWNTIYIPHNAVKNTTPLDELPVHGSLLTIRLENGSIDRFMANMEKLGLTVRKSDQFNPSFTFYDQGYSQIQPGLAAMQGTAKLLLVLSAILMIVTCILLSYFFAQNQKQSVGIYRMLGGSKLRSVTAVLLCILLIAAIAVGIGAAAGHFMSETVGSGIMSDNLANSEEAALFQAFTLVNDHQEQELSTQPNVALSATAAGIVLIMPVVFVLTFVLQYIGKEPRELLPKSKQ